MKKFWIILLAALLLAGCSGKLQNPGTTETTQSTANTQTTEPKPTEPGLYAPDSAAEQQTGGAVRAYTLYEGNWFGLSTIGTDLLVIGENAMLTLRGEEGWAVRVHVGALSMDTEMDTYTSGVAYYAPETRIVTVLSPELQQLSELELPETVVGTPVISLIRNEVYYFTGAEIRAINLTTGISRLLRQQESMEALLSDDYFDGNVLSCQVKDATGTVRTEYFSSETGQTYSQDQGIFEMQTAKDRYFIRRMDIQVQQMIFGTRSGEPKSLLIPPSEDSELVPVLEMNGVVSCRETAAGLELSFYSLATGKRTAWVSLAGVMCPAAIRCDGAYIWILAEEGGKQTLFRWDIAKSPVQDETVYTGPFYSPQNPDTKGLQECQKVADSYKTEYGVKVNIWKNAVKVTGDYTVVAEHQPQTVQEMLEKLQPTLAKFPDKFLQKTVEAGWIQVSLVRSIEGDRDWAHFWKDGDCWILISAKADVANAFIRGVAYAIDSHVLGNSRDFDFDRWNPLNPKGFAYANSYEVQPKQEYLQGSTRAFTDAMAMSFIHEDRCRIFYNAMLKDNAEMFKASAMQAKLKRVCMGIREAYGLQKSEKTYPWEQYLTTSLAYVKK
ncbi:MAG: hypothetical protein IJ030_01410 [Oscillospiraceae bacterium]|nr:hypothetical protein [Oscillospiraceae bacterium]